MTISLSVGWYLWLIPIGGVIAGVVGRRSQLLRYVLAVLAPIYALGLLALFLVASFLKDVGEFGVVVIAIATLLSLAPLVSWWSGSRTPSVLATVALAALSLFFILGLLIFLPASSGVLAAAIAGPPRPRVTAAPSVRADDDRLDALE